MTTLKIIIYFIIIYFLSKETIMFTLTASIM
jgi:hypothetical protein